MENRQALTPFEDGLLAYHNDTRITCPECADQRKKNWEKTLSIKIEHNRVLYNCWHCTYNGVVFRPEANFTPLPSRPVPPPKPVVIPLDASQDSVREYLNTRGISLDDVKDWPITSGKHWFASVGETQGVGFIYGDLRTPEAIKWRTTEGKSFSQDGAARSFYGLSQFPDDEDTLVIVEGEIDALTLASIGVPALSCPNGAPQKVSDRRILPEEDKKFGFVWEARDLIERCSKIVLATDDDDAGAALAEEIARRVGREKCWRVSYPDGTKDANEALKKCGKDALKDAIDNAEAMPLEGVFSAENYSSSVLDIYSKGLGKGVSTGIYSVDNLFTIAPGLHIVTGLPNSGKSEFIDQLMVNVAQLNHWKFAVCSFENPGHFHIAKLAEKICKKPFFQGFDNRLSGDELDGAMTFINEHFVFLDEEGGGDTSIDSIISRAKQAIMRMGVRGLVIDPYNYIETKGSKEEHLSINELLTKISKFGKAHDLAIFFIAHPMKMRANDRGVYPVPYGNDISGSAAWFAKADVGITVHREDHGVSSVHSWKVRFKWIGQQGKTTLEYDIPTGSFSEMAMPPVMGSTTAGISAPQHWQDIEADLNRAEESDEDKCPF